MILVVTGSRSITEANAGQALAALLGDQRPTLLIHGGAKGVDRGCAAWATGERIEVREVPAVWTINGQRDLDAGKRRNWTMLRRAVATGKTRELPVVLAAIWDGWSGGTAHCIAAAAVLGVPCLVAYVEVR